MTNDEITTQLDNIDRASKAIRDGISTNVVTVKKGDDLQRVLAGLPGTGDFEVRVYPETYGGIKLPLRQSGVVTVKPDTSFIPAEGARTDASYWPACVKLLPNAGGTGSSIIAGAGVSGWNLIGLAPVPGDGGTNMIELGDFAIADPAQAPSGIIIDRCIVSANPTTGGKRGVLANTGALVVRGSFFDNFWWQDDSQAVGGSNGPGPFLIENNWMAASGETLMFGGSDAKNVSMLPSRAIIRRNTLTKHPEWKGQAGATTKSAFELKAMLTALIENNIIEYSWTSGQVGYIVVLTPRNQYGNAPFTEISDIVMRNNVIRHGSGHFNLLGFDNEHPSQQLARVKILNNVCYDLDGAKYPGAGRSIEITAGVSDVEFGHNTFIAKNHGSFLALDGPQINDKLYVHDNVFYEGEYGMAGNNTGLGKPAWDTYTTNGTFANNLIGRGTSGRNVPYPGTGTVLSAAGEQVTDAATLKVISKYAATATTDGKPVGAPVDDVLRLTGAVV